MSPSGTQSAFSTQHMLGWLGQKIIVAPKPDRPVLGSVSRSTFEISDAKLENSFLEAAWKLSAKMLAGHVTGEKRTFTVEVPASWWQHLRLSVPAWYRDLAWVKRYRRKHPVRMTSSSAVIDFSRHLAYPLAEIALPPQEFGYGVVVDVIDQEIVSPWPAHCEPTETEHATRYHLASAIERTLPLPDFDHLTGSYRSVRALDVLNTMARLGINPDQLIPAAVLDSQAR